MGVGSAKKLALESLGQRAKAVTPAAVPFYKEQCMVCFHKNGHRSGVNLHVSYEDSDDAFQIVWSGDVTDRMLNYAYVDKKKCIDFGACAIALLLVPELTSYQVERASDANGSGIDYYLGLQGQDDDLIFNHAARLEVSGILQENKNNTVQQRVNEKKKRLSESSSISDFTPTYIIIVEFSRPWSKVVQE